MVKTGYTVFIFLRTCSRIVPNEKNEDIISANFSKTGKAEERFHGCIVRSLSGFFQRDGI
jgi:hypothetical protein